MVEGFTSDEIDEFFSQPIVEENAKSPQVVNEKLTGSTYHFDGSIEFPRDVHAAGPVVWVKGDCRFQASVKNMIVIALGNVTVKEDCRDSTIYSLGMISVRRTINCSLTSYRELQVLAESEKSVLMTAGNINAPQAAFRGGRVEAHGDIELGKASSLGGTNRLSLVSGEKKLLLRKLQLVESQYENMEDKLNNVKKSVQNFVKVLIAKNLLGRKIPEFEELKKRQANLEKLVLGTKFAAEKLRSALNKDHHSFVAVHGPVSKEILIEVDGWHFETNDEYYSTRFTHDTTRVVVEKMNL